MPPRKPPSRIGVPSLADDDDELTQMEDFSQDPLLDESLDDQAFEDELLNEDLMLEEVPGEETVTSLPRRNRDTFEDSAVTMDPRRTIQALSTSPEVTAAQGGWRERNFNPRGTMPPAQVLAGMERALKIASMQRGAIDKTRTALKAEWLPLLRQAVEQAGGDGLDAHLAKLVMPPGRPPRDTLLQELCAAMDKLNRAKDLPTLITEGRRAGAAVKKALGNAKARKLSLKFVEEELEGRLEVDALLAIFFSGEAELNSRLLQVTRTLESIRDQLRAMPGTSPDGLFRNFSKLKIERRLMEAEQRRRFPPRD